MFSLVSVSVKSLIFDTLLFVGLVAMCSILVWKEISYSKLSSTVTLAIVSPTVTNNGIFKG